MAATAANDRDEKGMGEVVGDLWQLVRDYAKQETVDPLRSIGRFLALGVAGSLLLGLGILFAALAVLRALQNETGDHLTGSWSWLPYLASFLITAVAVALALRAVTKPVRTDRSRP